MLLQSLTEQIVFARRGRGIGRLIEGATEGDPVAFTIIGVIVVGIIGYVIYQAKSGD